MEFLSFSKRGLQSWLWLVALAVLAGCSQMPTYSPIPEPGTTGATGAPEAGMDDTNSTLRVGDQLTVSFFDITPTIAPITDEIKEDGTITLIYNEKFQAAGKTLSELQTNVHDRYVPAYVKYMTVNIVPANRFYTVTGEVRAEGQQPYRGHMQVLQAIATAGGFTDYANKKKVQITRAGSRRQFTVDCVKALDDPDLNVEIYPGDTIHVPHSWF